MEIDKSIGFFLICLYFVTAAGSNYRTQCETRARTESGWVCGRRRWSASGGIYASFRGVPYAKQPVGELRFKELQPAEPWKHDYDASEEGPVCIQTDEFFGYLTQQDFGMSEACIHANIHVPIYALPHDKDNGNNYTSTYDKSKDNKDLDYKDKRDKSKYHALPILVFVHGGGFTQGSGDADLLGPEYLVSKDVIVITFNYRINVFGFLSLNTPNIPGNQGLRDMVTLLRWVQRNARNFGGDPDDVTLMGQSAGASAVHLLTLSEATKGLFKRAILMSGTALPVSLATTPIYASVIATRFFGILGIFTVDPEERYKALIKMPIERIVQANKLLQDMYGIVTFSPVVETRFPGVTTVLDKDPETLIFEGRGKEYPLIIGYTTDEAETFRRILNYKDYVARATANPTLLLPCGVPPSASLESVKKSENRYFKHGIDLDGIVKCSSEAIFINPAFRLARIRANMGAASTYLYQFSYISDFNVVKKGILLKYKGTAHIEDLTYAFRANSILHKDISFPPIDKDDLMKDWMTMFIVNFMQCSDPTCNKNYRKSGWPEVKKDLLVYEDIRTPLIFKVKRPNRYQKEMIEFFDKIHQSSILNVYTTNVTSWEDKEEHDYEKNDYKNYFSSKIDDEGYM